MAFLTEDQVRRRAQSRAQRQGMTVEKALNSVARADKSSYDVFLSQTIRDRELVLGVYAILTEDLGLTVFCDWIDSPDTDRANVTPENAHYVREKMKHSDSLLFLDTQNADQSKWMCWELGWFDAAKGKVGVLPVVRSVNDPYRGREFLGLYPVVEIDAMQKLKVSATPELLRRIMTPGQVYGLATSFPLKFWATASRDPLSYLR
ncbi:toll-Interleukin receptor [Mesorhizobium sp. B1-1-6]|uniref:toll-Interleukin receptor n=1 Tax=Mesorhizobium sp. B1-1-6 TaxID=2589978 RepID=UPI00112E933C|nr:toll-Interleukin receptor [Mesorhizobium sp. B1-1-6]TPN33201.1 toll-Interleukin receptor [Mesorhizobium sp. B1-1-6]